jgi:holo-[acyl-carrier protein] synthase
MLKIGTDICSLKRIEAILARRGRAFLERIMTLAEIQTAEAVGQSRLAAHVAGRFAAKEAVAKALGTGISAISWQHIEILRQPSGQPTIVLHEAAAVISSGLGLSKWELSISHEREFAVAFAVGYRAPPS